MMVWKYEKPQLKGMARNLRTEMTEAERKLWAKLRGKQINGLQFYRQRPIGLYIVDFYCFKRNLVIEIDGGQHYEDDFTIKKDQQRTAYLKEKFGLRVLRFTNVEVLKNIEGVLMKIIEEIDKSTPVPPLKKEGGFPPFFKGRLGGIYYKDWSFILIKGGRIIYKSKDKGLASLLVCLKKYRRQMQGVVVYDKIVGRAAALLLVCGGVKKVLTPRISRGALAYLRQNGVVVKYGKVVKNIMNRAGTDLCPMEKLSAGKSAEEWIKMLDKNL